MIYWTVVTGNKGKLDKTVMKLFILLIEKLINTNIHLFCSLRPCSFAHSYSYISTTFPVRLV